MENANIVLFAQGLCAGIALTCVLVFVWTYLHDKMPRTALAFIAVMFVFGTVLLPHGVSYFKPKEPTWYEKTTDAGKRALEKTTDTGKRVLEKTKTTTQETWQSIRNFDWSFGWNTDHESEQPKEIVE